MNWFEGGLGNPQSGEMSLASDYSGYVKYFGVFGESDDDDGTYGISVTPDLCTDRFVALTVHVFDDSEVDTSDVFEVSVGAHTVGTTYELTLDPIPDYSHIR
jgi:hypothetical protein